MQLGNTISRNKLTMMNAPKSHTCRFLPYGVKIEAKDTENGLTWFLIISLNDDDLEEFSTTIMQCSWCPEKLIDYAIVNLSGPHPPNEKGEYLCNGNCDWEGCNMGHTICKECGYIGCDRCGEYFDSAIHQVLNREDNGDTFCRGCLFMNTEEYI